MRAFRSDILTRSGFSSHSAREIIKSDVYSEQKYWKDGFVKFSLWSRLFRICNFKQCSILHQPILKIVFFDWFRKLNISFQNLAKSFSGKLILAVPSEGCIGQRAVDSILSDEGNNFEFYGSFDATSIQPMVGRVENGRVVTCMELFFSPTTEIGLVQLRAPPLSNSSFCAEFIPWFRASG